MAEYIDREAAIAAFDGYITGLTEKGAEAVQDYLIATRQKIRELPALDNGNLINGEGNGWYSRSKVIGMNDGSFVREYSITFESRNAKLIAALEMLFHELTDRGRNDG